MGAVLRRRNALLHPHQWWGIDVQGDQVVVLTVLDLVNVAPRCHGHRACSSLVDRKWQTRNRTKNSLGRLARKDHHAAITRAMIVHGRSLAWAPTKDEHLSVRQVDHQIPFVGVRVEPDEGLRVGEDLAMIDLRKKFGHRLRAKRCAIANELAELGQIQAGNGRILHGYISESESM